ncbi:MAG: hypothetical protein ACI8R4_004348 [Paracoccaceae bacterium]|jgi:hypothetical protein
MTKTKGQFAAAAMLALLATLSPRPADAFNGKFGVRVAPVNDVVFEVVPRSSGTGPIFWCGAADYARQVLGAGWKTTIYIARGRGQSVTTNRRSAVQFTLDPSAAGITPIEPSLSLNALKVGDNMTVQQANHYCSMPPSRF